MLTAVSREFGLELNVGNRCENDHPSFDIVYNPVLKLPNQITSIVQGLKDFFSV